MSNGTTKRAVRLSQAISPFGVGAIYDILGESLVACDTTYWNNRHDGILKADRLAASLGVREFRIPPTTPPEDQQNEPTRPLVYARFPQWLFCPNCRQLLKWSPAPRRSGMPVCPHCPKKSKLVPMRFITICENGHMSDVPWDLWAHSRAATPQQKQCSSQKLKFEADGRMGGSLAALKVVCDDCGAGRSLEGIASKDSLATLQHASCSGKQPWQSSEKFESCSKVPQVVQRGASNVYFPLVRSAIDIPPESNYDPYADLSRRIMNHETYPALRSKPNALWAPAMKDAIAEDIPCTVEDVERCLRYERDRSASTSGAMHGPEPDSKNLESAEWTAWLARRDDYHPKDNFITKHVELLPSPVTYAWQRQMADLINCVVVATRLREVRALAGFSRYRPGTPSQDDPEAGRLLQPDLGAQLPWLPAIEVFGEGIFVALNETRLQQWEESPGVEARAAVLEGRRRASFYKAFMPEATPRFLLLHTLAHLLIRQLAFDCGYSSTSLRERIYCRAPKDGEPMAGVLIYTAAGDGEGTLGGLARQGEPPRLARTIIAALQTAGWCSADPICIESTGQGIGGLNLGACHACGLISETSCTFSNLLLDRAMLVGSLDKLDGYFTEFIETAAVESIEEMVTI